MTTMLAGFAPTGLVVLCLTMEMTIDSRWSSRTTRAVFASMCGPSSTPPPYTAKLLFGAGEKAPPRVVATAPPATAVVPMEEFPTTQDLLQIQGSRTLDIATVL